MATDLLGAKVDSVGRVIFDPDPAARKIFFDLVFETPAGAEFKRHSSQAARQRLANVLEQKFLSKNRDITVDVCAAVIADLIAVKDPALFPAPEPVVEAADGRERNADGTFKSAFQIFAETHSAAECSAYAKQNSEFAKWRRGQFQVEGLQPGSFRLAGTPLADGTVEHPARRFASNVVADFAKAYKLAPADRLRARCGRVTLDENHAYKPEDYELLVNQATEAGLL